MTSFLDPEAILSDIKLEREKEKKPCKFSVNFWCSLSQKPDIRVMCKDFDFRNGAD